MAIDYTEFDRRTDTLVDALTSARTSYLGQGLPSLPAVYKGPWDAGVSVPEAFAIYVSRNGQAGFDYATRGEPVTVTQSLSVACVTSMVGEREEIEQWLGRFAANVTRCLLANTQVDGTDGWRTGLIVDSDATRFRTQDNSLFELELFRFDIRFEVDIA